MRAPADPGGPTRAQIALLGALSAFGPLSLDSYLPALPGLARDLHASAPAVQLTVTACMAGLGAGQLLAGPLSDARGRRRPLLAGVACYGAASAACALAPSIWALILCRLMQGLAGGAGIVIARAIVRDLTGGPAAARLFALLAGVTGLVPVCAPLVGAQLLRLVAWRGVFGALAAISVPLAAVTAALLPETLPSARRRGGGLQAVTATFAQLIADRRFWPYAAAFSLSFAAMFGYISGSSFVVQDVFGATPQLFSYLFATNAAALIAASLLGGRLAAARGPVAMVHRCVPAVALAALGVLVVTLLHAGLAPLEACFFLLAGSCGLVLPNGTAAAMAARRDALGAASALLGVGQFGAGALVAPLVGIGGGRDALAMALVIAAAGVAALMVAWTLAPRP